MKKASSLIGFFALFCITFATLFQVQHYPGGSMLLILGLSVFATFFIPLYFVTRILDEKTVIGKIGNGFAIFSLGSFFTGLLFKVQHYPGANLMLVLGALTFIFPTAILLLVASFKNESTMKEFLKSVVIAAFVSGWVLLFGFKVPTSELLSNVLFIDEELTSSFELVEKRSNEIASQLKGNNSLTDEEKNAFILLNQKRISICAFIDELDKDLIIKTGGVDSELSTSGHWGVKGIREMDISNMIMINGQAATRIKSLLEEYDVLASKCKTICESKGTFVKIKSAKNVIIHSHSNSQNKSWEVALFDHSPLFITLPVLTSIKNRVVITELNLMSSIAQ